MVRVVCSCCATSPYREVCRAKGGIGSGETLCHDIYPARPLTTVSLAANTYCMMDGLSNVKNIIKIFIIYMYSTLHCKDTDLRYRGTQLNQARSKPDLTDQPVRTARATVHHCNGGTQYCSTETVLLTILYLHSNTPCMSKV